MSDEPWLLRMPWDEVVDAVGIKNATYIGQLADRLREVEAERDAAEAHGFALARARYASGDVDAINYKLDATRGVVCKLHAWMNTAFGPVGGGLNTFTAAERDAWNDALAAGAIGEGTKQ